MAESITTDIPEQGQLVEDRQRRYVVNDVVRSTLPGAELAMVAGKPRHLVSLTSVDDDGLGEELQVIWELEPRARAFDPMALPQPVGFGTLQRLDALLDAMRWGDTTTEDLFIGDPQLRTINMPHNCRSLSMMAAKLSHFSQTST